ncbi:MAG: HNH endonuclease [Alphaproteobacteria bacterium]|nr:HNH endonuclease [Alphaproteobacteria bacterium]MDE6571034.1 HNH endonuclease [Alphaproteobacteria bacterium]
MRPEDIKKLILSLAACADKLNKHQVKELYRMMIACGKYPICPACHQPITTMQDFSWDHIYPASRGGSHDIRNMQPMHRVCNEAKSDIVQEQYFDTEYTITTEVRIELIARKEKRKKKKNRKVTHLKPHQIAEMGFIDRRGKKR